MYRYYMLVLVALVLASAPGMAARAAQPAPFDLNSAVKFGSSVKITGTLHSASEPKKVFIFAHEQGTPNTYTRPVKVTRLDGDSYQLEHTIDLAELTLRAFSTLEYRVEATLESGEVLVSPVVQVVYEDDRFPWNTLVEPPYRLHYYEGSTPFAQELLDTAQNGLARTQTLLDVDPPAEIDIYIYPNSAALQETLTLSGRSWLAGHADPDIGKIVVSLPAGPEQQLLAEQRIPHELMHVLLYQATGAGYAALPTWLNEGLASTAELYPNPDYETLLNDAFGAAKLIPISFLCDGFPQDASSALLAYAQSASFTNYIYQRYGQTGLRKLIDQYAQGLGCDQGPVEALGETLSRLDSDWQAARFGASPVQATWQRLAPWLIILAAVILPLLLLTVFKPRQKPTR